MTKTKLKRLLGFAMFTFPIAATLGTMYVFDRELFNVTVLTVLLSYVIVAWVYEAAGLLSSKDEV